MILQVLPSISPHDAISQHVLRLDTELTSCGIETAIVAEHISPHLQNRATAASSFDHFNDHHILYHLSIASHLAEKVHDSTSVVDIWYHNITPAQYFEEWEPYVSLELRIARHQLEQMAVRARRGVAASVYSEEELKKQGCRDTCVMPVLFDPSEKLGAQGGQGLHVGTQILSVGRYAPHKRVEKIIETFSIYRDLCDSRAHLHLVGSSSSRWYKESLDQLIDQLKVTDAISFHDSVSDEDLSRLYHSSDIYLCMSQHEGFCVPLVEAQLAGLPIVASSTSAIPETVGQAGILLDPDAALVEYVAAIDTVISNQEVARKLAARAREGVERFDITRESERAVQWLVGDK